VRAQDATRLGFTLPLPRFVLNPLTALGVAVVHVYLAAGHLLRLFGGDVAWTHIWKGFGALAGAYVFVAIASRGRARSRATDVAREGAGQASATAPRREERGVGAT
jgi:hypothetical protein